MKGDILEGIRTDLDARVRAAIGKAMDDGVLARADLPADLLEVPREKGHGDFASNVALVLARRLRRKPRDVAAAIVARLDTGGSFVERVEVAGPGFINFFLSPSWLHRVLVEVQEQGDGYGRNDQGRGQRVQVEFVSANPTGPLNVVNARAGAAGDVLANLLSWCGYDVEREFYINDAGHQVEMLGRSLEARYRQLLGEDAPVPEDGYPGEYLVDIAREIVAERGRDLLNLAEAERREFFKRRAVTDIVSWQRQTLAEYGVEFDVWFSEKSLHDTGAVAEVTGHLSAQGHTYRRDGALWFRSTAFGDDKDRVLVKSDGEYTYLAADIAYHRDKFRRGFDRVVDIWGPDHHGHIARMKAAVQALGHDPGALEVLIAQLVRLHRKGEAVRMSKRGGEFVTMNELLEEVGRDAARFFFLLRSLDSHLDFDLHLAVQQSSENPVYYVQYAHARICSILRQGEGNGEGAPPGAEASKVPAAREAPLRRLVEPEELDLARKMAEFPGEVKRAAQAREPHHLTRYAMELASLFHVFYTRHRVLGDDPDLTAARLVLADAVRVVLRQVLRLLGVRAPSRM